MSKEERARETAFEIIAAYFVTVYDDHLYYRSKSNKESGYSPSITEAYRDSVGCYLRAIRDRSKKPEESPYRTVILNLLNYYREWSSYSTITLAEFIDTIVYHFTPRDKYRNMDNTAKDRLLRDSLTKVLTNFTISVIKNHLHIIIDNRDSEFRNLRTLQNEFIQCMKNQRDHIFELFIEAGAGPSGQKRAEGVSVAVVEKMKQMLKKTLEEKAELQNKLVNYNKNTSNVINQLKDQIKLRDVEIQEKDEQILDLERALVEKNQELSDLREQLYDKDDNIEMGVEEYRDEDKEKSDDSMDEGTEEVKDEIEEKQTVEENEETPAETEMGFKRQKRKTVSYTLPEDDDFMNF